MVDDSMSPCAVLESDHFLGHIVTDVPTLSFAFTWEITAFSSLPHGNGEVLGSCALEAPDLEGKWSLHLYPRGITVEDEGYVSLYLRYSGGSKVEAAFTLRCGTDDEALPFCKTDTNSFSPNHKSWGWNKFVERHTLVGFLQQRAPAHPLYIHCHVQASGTVTTRRVPPNNPPTCDPEVVAALGQALYQDPGTDVVLLVQGHAIPAHRSILVVQSPVFRAMFSHDLTEKNTGQVEILDHTADAVCEMKRFLYTGQVERIGDVGAELLDLAVAYDLPRLKGLCANALPLLLTESNVCRVFAAAHTHALQDLKDSAVRFICHNRAVFATPEWKEYIASDADLVTALLVTQATAGQLQ